MIDTIDLEPDHAALARETSTEFGVTDIHEAERCYDRTMAERLRDLGITDERIGITGLAGLASKKDTPGNNDWPTGTVI